MSRLDEIKARADAATEGPWVRDMHSPDMSGRSGWYIRGPRKLGLRSMVLNSRMLSGDAEFIEASREDVPWLVDQVESLERWKVEALEVMSGLRELGKALGLGLGVQITGPAALAEVARLTAERDALAAQVAEAVHLTDVWVSDLATDAMVNVMDGAVLEAINEQMKRLLDLRDALTDSDANASDTQPIDQEKQ